MRVVGVLKSAGTGLGMDTDQLIIVPVALAHACSIRTPLPHPGGSQRAMRGDPEPGSGAQHPKEPAPGRRDVTVTQDAVLATFDKLLGALTLGWPASPPSVWQWPAFWS